MNGKIVAVIGNSGAGKTLLTHLLCQAGPFASSFEQHQERPFQQLFMQQRERYALPNQVDYLLYRAEQEIAARQSAALTVQDGGLDLDFHLFTRYFLNKGYLSQAEYGLCERLYNQLRTVLPAPDLFVCLDAPLAVLAARRALRARAIDIAESDDLGQMQRFLEEWTRRISPTALVRVNSAADPQFAGCLPGLLERIRLLLPTYRSDD